MLSRLLNDGGNRIGAGRPLPDPIGMVRAAFNFLSHAICAQLPAAPCLRAKATPASASASS